MARHLAQPATGGGAEMPGHASRAALWLIGLYQRRISPHKGFRCAYAVAHGGPGCSGFAATAIRTRGFWRALAPIRRRFRDCRAALVTLSAAPAGGDGPSDDADGKKSCLWQAGGVSCLGFGESASACAACDIGAISCCG